MTCAVAGWGFRSLGGLSEMQSGGVGGETDDGNGGMGKAGIRMRKNSEARVRGGKGKRRTGGGEGGGQGSGEESG